MSIENHVHLIGNLGQDPELKYAQSGTAVARVSLATSSYKKEADGNRVEKTEWHRLVFYGKLAEIVGRHLTKGRRIAVQGSIRYDSYEKDGVKRYTTEIVCDQMDFQDKPDRPATSRNDAPDPRAAAAGEPYFEDDDIHF